MALTILSNCEEDEIIDPFYPNDDCPPETEKGRVRSSGYLKGSTLKATILPLLATLKAAEFADPFSQSDYDDALDAVKAAFQTATDNRDFYPIRDTIGTFDGGSEVTGPGYGDQAEITIGIDYTVNYSDPNWKYNQRFYDTIMRARNWYYVWRTDTGIRISNAPVKKFAKDPVEDSITSDVVWNIDVKWSGNVGTLPIYTDLTEVFTYSPAQGGGTGGLQAPTGLQLTQKTALSFLATWTPAAGATGQNIRVADGQGSPVVTNAPGTSFLIEVSSPDTTVVVDIQSKDSVTTSNYSATATGNTFDTSLDFGAATSVDNGNGGVEATVLATDADQRIDFDTIPNATGAGQTMAITVGGTQEVSVTYPSPYNGTPFAYFDKAGAKHFSTFANGTKAF
jgi:hypothetical protein